MPKLKEVAPRVRIGRGISRNNLTIFPLFAEDHIAPSQYVPVGDAIREGAGKVTEISEAGSVPKLAIDNLGTIPILIIDGEELIGARQNRIANLSVLAPARKMIPIPVSCVERGRWGYQSAAAAHREFTDSPQVMYHQARAQKSRDITTAYLMGTPLVADQGGVWQQIQGISRKMGFASSTEAMSDVYTSQKSSIDDYLKDVNVADGQIGAVFAINGIPAGVELFDSGETLKKYMPKIVRSYALDALANQATKAKPASDAEALKLVDSVMELDAQSFPAVGLGEDLRIETKDITGGALTFEGRVIHLAAFQTQLK